jgi:hypothetical protein
VLKMEIPVKNLEPVKVYRLVREEGGKACLY